MRPTKLSDLPEIQPWLERLIRLEFEKQDYLWGGVEHDDLHSGLDWVEWIQNEIEEYYAGRRFDDQMLKVACLALRAIESFHRKNGME